MAPTRAMTDDTIVNDVEKGPRSPTDTENTLGGDAIIEIGEDDVSTRRSSSDSRSRSSLNDAPAQPQDEKTRPTFFRRVTGSFKSEPEPLGVTEINTRQLDNTPNGFPRLAAFQSSESNFSLYRSFTYLHSRILLDLQDEIRNLEKELDDIDWDDFDDDPERLRSRETDVARAANEGDARNRRVILKEIKTKLMEYDEVLIKARTLDSFQKPSDRNYRSVRRFHHNHKPLLDAETDSIRSKEDTVSLRNSGREGGSFDGGLEKAIFKVDSWIMGVARTFGIQGHNTPLGQYFQSPELRAKTTNKYITLYSSSRIDKLANILITLVIFILLVVPVVAMYLLTSTNLHIGNESGSSDTVNLIDNNTRDTLNAVGLLIVFTLLFSAAMSLLTKAARHELFAASAAYCAILVVFIGNFTGPGN